MGGTFVRFEEYVAQRRTALCRFAGVLSGDPVLAERLIATRDFERSR